MGSRKIWAALAASAFLFAACNDGAEATKIASVSEQTEFPANRPGATPAASPRPAPIATSTPVPAPSGPGVVGDGCHSSDKSAYCLAIKYVVYKEPRDSKGSTGEPVVDQQAAIANVKGMNAIYKPCKIAFQIDEFLAVDPTERKLRYNIANTPELDDVRREFVDEKTLLVVTTGEWDRTGSLGSTGANAWTAMPGGGPYGEILEEPVGTDAEILAHETGHYLNLDHFSDQTNVMNPIVFKTSTLLTASQCQQMRAAATTYWEAMFR